MPSVKPKSHKGLRKRVRITASGLVKFKPANAGHLMSTKSGNRRRKLRKTKVLVGTIRHAIVRAVRGQG